MQFSYDARPSFWQEVRSNSHLVIAAVGTAALLGVAGTALWLAMPAGDRQDFAQAEEPAPVSEPVAKADPAAAGKSAGGIELAGKAAVQEDPQAQLVSQYRRKLSMALN